MAGKLWTKREDKILKTLYPHRIYGDISWAEMEKIFHRSKSSIQHHAQVLGLTNMALDNINEEALKKWTDRLKLREL